MEEQYIAFDKIVKATGLEPSDILYYGLTFEHKQPELVFYFLSETIDCKAYYKELPYYQVKPFLYDIFEWRGVAVEFEQIGCLTSDDFRNRAEVRDFREFSSEQEPVTVKKVVFRGDLFVRLSDLSRLFPETFPPPKEENAQLKEQLQAAKNSSTEESTPDNHLPLILDETYPHYAPELALAVRTWLSFFGDKENIPKRKTKEQIAKEARRLSPKDAKNKPIFSHTTLERIATVVNPNKKGGSPETL